MDRIGIKKIVSGGQTGVDLAAVDVAIGRGIDYGGWCPQGRINENGRIADKYECFQEVNGDFSTDTDNYAARTVRNIVDSDGTLIIVPTWPLPEKIKDGTLLTIEAVKTNQKPYLVISLAAAQSDNFQELARWINEHGIQTLNVAGPRESSSPGIYGLSTKLIDDAISHIQTLI